MPKRAFVTSRSLSPLALSLLLASSVSANAAVNAAVDPSTVVPAVAVTNSAVTPSTPSALALDTPQPQYPSSVTQEDDETSEPDDAAGDAAGDNDEDDKEEEESLEDILADQKQFAGLFMVARDAEDGSALLVLNKTQLNTPFLYAASTVDGVVAAGHFRGNYRDAKVIEFRQFYDRIDVVQQNRRFYFDPNTNLAKAADANISEAVLATLTIEHQDDTRLAISLDSFLLNEKLTPIAPFPSSNSKVEKRRFKLGKLDNDKTRIREVRNFPENTHVVVDYIYQNMAPRNFGGPEHTDPRFTTISLQHAFVELPSNDYQPRRDDARVGYFTQYITDLTSGDNANYRDLIERWHLVKKDPQAELSEPVTPITWWIENTTPDEWRDIIKDAVLAWNFAFESAGFKNAIEVKIQPDDADWEADDVRYNVLRWTSSPRPPFGGYGPSLANPLTGEIIAADIMLEYVFMKNRWIYNQLFTDGVTELGTYLPQNGLPQNGLPAHITFADNLKCSRGAEINMGVQLGALMAKQGLGTGYSVDQNELLRQALTELILHEVGHTLGLNHNMMASQLHNATEVHDKAKTKGVISGSVMDYHPVNLAPPGRSQGDFYNTLPGPYDHWAITYGYSPSLADPVAEEERLEAILSLSTQPEHAFGNDADDMRAAGRHIDPRINISDMSNEAVEYARGRFELIKFVAPEMANTVLQEGESHQDLLVAANILFSEFSRQASVVSRYVGGVQINRAVVGQDGYDRPYRPVDQHQQRAAIAVLNEYVFAADTIDDMEPLFAYLQPQRRGFARYGNNEDPKIHDALLNAQKSVLDHLLHPAVLKRITDSSLYGNNYSLTDMMNELTEGIFDADIRGTVNSYRQNLQTEYVERLIQIAGLEDASAFDSRAKAHALFQLKQVRELADNSRGDASSEIHKTYLVNRIDAAFERFRS